MKTSSSSLQTNVILKIFAVIITALDRYQNGTGHMWPFAIKRFLRRHDSIGP